MTVEDRLLAGIQISDTGCWIWQKATAKNGYGQIGHEGRTRSTHRLAYETFVGPVPEGLQLDHLCRVRACCNPEHLEPVTQSENIQRSPLIVKTHCKQGHELTEDNLIVRQRQTYTMRNCRTCHNESVRRRYHEARQTERSAA